MSDAVQDVLYFHLAGGITSLSTLPPPLAPAGHVRTRIYFTSESHIHSLMNVLRFAHFQDEYVVREGGARGKAQGGGGRGCRLRVQPGGV